MARDILPNLEQHAREQATAARKPPPGVTLHGPTLIGTSRPRQLARKKGIAHENRILCLSLGAGSVAVLVSMVLLWTGNFTPQVQWTLTLFIVSAWLGFAFAVRSSVIRPLQTLSNVQAALREGDFSMRVRGASHEDALGELMAEMNLLSDTLREQRLGAMEASALLGTVMAEIDVAIFAFDLDHRLRLVNRAGERLLAQNAERLLGKNAAELGLEECLQGEAAQTLEHSFPGRSGRWGVRRSTFRQGGVAHQLLVISDLSRALREEERQAWQRLVRVLGHELNNSLAPVCSIAQSLEMMLKRHPRAADWEDDLRRGLRVIAERSEALSRFMKDYARLARLPKPQLRVVELEPVVRGAAALESRLEVEVLPSPRLRINMDADQVQQALINLIRNAADAALETGGGVRVGWSANPQGVDIFVRDDGPGISNPANLFVPFFTTKQGGSGIGLVLSRQVAEAHGGNLTLANRADARGGEAHLHLPT